MAEALRHGINPDGLSAEMLRVLLDALRPRAPGAGGRGDRASRGDRRFGGRAPSGPSGSAGPPGRGAHSVLSRLQSMTAVAKVGLLTATEKREVRAMFDDLDRNDRATVNEQLLAALDRSLGVFFDNCWLPDDVAHFMRIKIDDAHEAFVSLAIESWAGRRARLEWAPPEWADAYASVLARRRDADSSALTPSSPASAELWIRLVAVLTAFLRIPEAMTMLCAPPRSWKAPTGATGSAPRVGITTEQVRATARKRGLDPDVLERVRALLAKAESTTFDAEADAFTSKAQEMMTKHGIEAAFLEAADESAAPIQRRFWIDNPYADAKGLLLSRVAAVNRCQSINHPASGCRTAVGFAADLDAVEVLFTSLLVQGATFVMAQGSQTDQWGRSSTASFRRSFWIAYGSRIGERLEESVAHTVAAANAEYHGTLLPVLASREEKVDQAYAEAFPDVITKRYSISNAAGAVAGRVAADQADISAAKARIDRY